MNRQKLHRLFLQFLIGLLVLNLGVLVMKNVVKQPRPTTILKDYSFPSQHSANAFFLATFVTLLPIGFAQKKKRQVKTSVAIGAYSVAVLVAYSRIYLNVHYWPDVIFGSIIGVLAALVASRL